MSRKDVLKQFVNPDVLTGKDAEKIAADFATAWREDCYVYMRPNIIVYSRGPDADHPKTTPTFIAKYNAPAKKARVES